jgi:hypothetical protein
VWLLGFLQEPHGITTQKTPFFIVTAVKTSNLTSFFVFTGGYLTMKNNTNKQTNKLRGV